MMRFAKESKLKLGEDNDNFKSKIDLKAVVLTDG